MPLFSRVFSPFLSSTRPSSLSLSKVATGKRAFRAPKDRNSVGGWVPMGSGSMERAPSQLALIRSRARDLAQNNPHAMRAVNVLTSHSIGTGIRASIRGDEAFEEAFEAWASSTDCDHERRQDFYGIQALATRTMIEAGDSLIVMRDIRTDDGLRLTLQVIDADQLDTSASPRISGNVTHQGVEVYPSGQIAGYHIMLSADSDKSTFILRRDAVQMIELLYAGQVRGVPRGSQVLVRAKGADDFLSVALARARTEACLTAFITTPNASTSPAMIGEETQDDGYLAPEVLEPGAVIPLNPGEDVKTVTPSTSGGLKDYVNISLNSVAVGYGVLSYHITGDLTGFNYSSGKFGLGEFYRSIDSLRAHTINPALMKIISRFRETYEANLGRDVTASVSLIPPRRESVEPLKDAQATAAKIQMGTLAWSDAVRAEGKDVEDHIAELLSVREKFAAAGMVFSVTAGPISITEAEADADDADVDPDAEDNPDAPEDPDDDPDTAGPDGDDE